MPVPSPNVEGERFSVTVDIAAFTIVDGSLCVLVGRRREPPYKGRWALPGGPLGRGEDLEVAARRYLSAATATPGPAWLRQIGAYGSPRRDPRGRAVSISWLAVIGAQALSAEAVVRAVPVLEVVAGRFAFDHDVIIADAAQRLADELRTSNVATALCPDIFTIAQLREVYEIIWQTDLDPANFHRKVTAVGGFVEPTHLQTAGARGRPALLYRAGPTTSLSPPVPRPT